MKALILAAGRGIRMGKYGEDRPKCLLAFQGRSLLNRQLETLRAASPSDIIVATGYRHDLIERAGVRTCHNAQWETTNMVESLMCARDELNDDVLLAYGDILYTPDLVTAMMAAEAPIAVAVDSAWREYWQVRYGTTEEDLESLTVTDGRITGIGRPVASSAGLMYRYIGLLKFRRDVWQTVFEVYDAKNRGQEAWAASGKPFRQGYMTDLLNEMIACGVEVAPVVTEHHWWEFDTEQDYELACRLVDSGEMTRFLP